MMSRAAGAGAGSDGIDRKIRWELGASKWGLRQDGMVWWRTMRTGTNRLRALLVLLLLGWSAGSGCSLLRRSALNQVANAVAGSGTTFASEEDPDLVKAAAPFSLKLMESLLAENPEHQGVLSAAASGFTQYAFAFVHQEADELEARDLAAAEALRTRARRLYLGSVRRVPA